MKDKERARQMALRALEAPLDLVGAVIEETPPVPMVVQSLRIPRELSDRLAAEAQRRGVTPGAVARELIDRGLREVEAEPTVQVKRSDLVRAIDQVVGRAA